MDIKFKYFKANPSGNMTGFILKSVKLKDRKKYANYIMNNIDKDVEQVGFISLSDDGKPFRMDMMGGEFCANATRAYALYCSLKDKNIKENIMVKVSGNKNPINVKINKKNMEAFIEMPKAKNIFMTKILNKNYFTVDLDGIVHIVAEEAENRKFVDIALKTLKKKIKSSAYGIMFIDKYNLIMVPYVYVVETHTLFREGSCGSGTVAAAYYLNEGKNKNFNIILKEPRGFLEIKTKCENEEIIYSIGGQVKFYNERIIEKYF